MWDNGGQSQSGSNVWQNPAAPGNQSWAGSGRPGYGPNPVYSPTGSLQRNDYGAVLFLSLLVYSVLLLIIYRYQITGAKFCFTGIEVFRKCFRPT